MTRPNLLLNLFSDKEAMSFAAGEFVFKAGDPGETMYIINEGEVEILDGSGTILETAGPGSIVGELALIDDEPRSATAVAATDVELIAVSEKQFLFLVGQTPYFALKVMRVLAQRLRQTNRTLA